MLSTFPFTLIISTVLGFLSALGIGGGSLLLLWLTAVLGMDAVAARSINLLFYLPCAGITCILRTKDGTLNWKSILPALIAGCAAAILAGMVSGEIRNDQLKTVYGVFMIGAGIRELCYRPRKLR